jgi:hypothetical protein
MQQKLLYTLLIASRKLCHYFQGHPIKVVTDRPLETILRNPNVTGRVAEWAVELQPLEISFKTTKVIKSKALGEFTAEWTDPFTDEPPEVESTLPREEAPGLWVMHFDGAFNLPGVGAGAVLTFPSRTSSSTPFSFVSSRSTWSPTTSRSTKDSSLAYGRRALWASNASSSREIHSWL